MGARGEETQDPVKLTREHTCGYNLQIQLDPCLDSRVPEEAWIVRPLSGAL